MGQTSGRIAREYPDLDNVHRSYYPDKGIHNNLDQSCFAYILEKTKGFNGIATSFYGELTDYATMFSNCLNYARSFYHIGAKPEETATFLMPSCPDTYNLYYGLDIGGLKRNFIDLRTPIFGIEKYINETESKYLICLENFSVPKIKKLLNETSIEKVIVAPIAYNALRKEKRFGAQLLMQFQELAYGMLGNDVFMLDDFRTFSKYVDSSINVAAKINPKATSTYVHTSGTTSGKNLPKTVMISDYLLNSVADAYEKSRMSFEPNDKFLAIMPPWIIYGILAFNTSFATRMNVVPVFDPTKESFDKLILDTKANHVAGVPNHYITLLESELINPDTDLSFLKTCACGGAGINSEKQRQMQDFLKDHGSDGVFCPGYSLSENTSTATVNQKGYTRLGSVGILLPRFEGMIIDGELYKKGIYKPLKYGEEGIICLRGAIMNGYLNNPEATAEVIKTIEGNEWVITADWGKFDKDGFLYVTDRLKNLITAPDGYKISNDAIETVICKHKAVKNCVVFGLKDPNYESGDYPVAYIELKNSNFSRLDQQRIFQEISRNCKEELASYCVPRYYYFGEIVYTPMMKCDKSEMQGIVQEEIDGEEKKPVVLQKLKRIVGGTSLYK